MNNKPYTVPKIRSNQLEVEEVAVLIPYETLKGDVRYYTLIKSKNDKLVPSVAKGVRS